MAVLMKGNTPIGIIDENDKIKKTELTDVDITGTTNTTGNTILKDFYFCLNGSLVRALVDIADGATFTEDTNYEKVTAGALNELQNSKVSKAGDTMSGTLTLGNSGVRGDLRIIGNDKTHYGRFYNTSGAPLTDNRSYNLPDKGGTLALIEDMSVISSASGTGYEVKFVSIGNLKFIYLFVQGLPCTAIAQTVITVDCPTGFSFSGTRRMMIDGDYVNQSGRVSVNLDIGYSSSKIKFNCYPVINNQYSGNLSTSINLYGNGFVMI